MNKDRYNDKQVRITTMKDKSKAVESVQIFIMNIIT